MLIKKIISLCTKEEQVCTLKKGDTQFLGNGQAFYVLNEEIPWLSEYMFCAAFDIKEKKAEKIHFSFGEPVPEGYDFGDATESENQVEQINGIGIQYNGKSLIPFKTSEGIAYLDKAHFAPLADLDGDMIYVFERRSKNGALYFAVKFGFVVVAVIMPCDSIVDKSLADDLKTVAELTGIRIENMMKSGGKR